MDADSLLKGQSYREVKESIVIFLCRYDHFKKDIPCYTIQRTCKQDVSIFVDDAATVQIFNCTAYEKIENKSLQAFLKFVQTGTAESDFTRRLNDMVETQKKAEELKKVYLSWSLHDSDVRYEGKREGMTEKAIESAKNLLAMDVLSHEQIAQAVGLPLETVHQLSEQL